MTTSLPDNPSLEHLRNQAKRLHRAYLSGRPEAIERVGAHFPTNATETKSSTVQAAKLSAAQLTIAREYSFASWPKLVEHVELADPRRLEEAFQTVKSGWFKPEHVPGDPAKLRRMLRRTPGLVHVRLPRRGYTLLHFAAYRNYVEVGEILIAAGADVHARSTGGATPLSVALTYPAPDMARRLAQFGIVPYNLRTTSGLGRLDLVKQFFTSNGELTPEASADREGWAAAYDFSDRPLAADRRGILTEALIYSAQNGHKDVTSFLLDAGADPNYRVFVGTVLHYAALYDQREMVDFLIDRGANPNILDDDFGGPPAAWARYFGQMSLARHLIDRGALISASDAVAYDYAGKLEELLRSGAPLHDANDALPLIHQAARSGAGEEVINVLLHYGADLNADSPEGTPLDIAQAASHSLTATLLRARGAWKTTITPD